MPLLLRAAWGANLAPPELIGADHISAVDAWHGRLMVLAWTILLPLGILVARYLKVMPGQDWPGQLDNRRWWHGHLALQIGGVLCMSAAIAVVWNKTRQTGFGDSLHTTLGWLVVLLGWMQLLGGYLRGSKGGPSRNEEPHDLATAQRGDHYDMTHRRVVFEWMHKLGGYTAVIIGVAVTALGLKRADAPLWMWWVIVLWWTLLLVAFGWLQRMGRCIDTYQAIWGPDPRHPGNARHAIGWGISRYTAAEFRRRFGSNR